MLVLPVLKHHLGETNQGAHPTVPGGAGIVVRGRGGVPVLLAMMVVRVPVGLAISRGDGQGPRGAVRNAGGACLGGGERRGEDDTRHGLLLLACWRGEEARSGKERGREGSKATGPWQSPGRLGPCEDRESVGYRVSGSSRGEWWCLIEVVLPSAAGYAATGGDRSIFSWPGTPQDNPSSARKWQFTPPRQGRVDEQCRRGLCVQ